MFPFRHLEDIPIGSALVPADLLEMIDLLQAHCDAFETVGDLDRWHIQNDTASLLEVGKLGDFLTIQPNFPAEPPGGKRRRFPVIFHEANVMLFGVNAQSEQRFQVKLLRVTGIGFEDYLELGMLLQAVWVDAVAAVIRAHRWFRVSNPPGLRTEHTQKGGGIHRASSDLGIIRLPDQATLPCPVSLQFEDNGLKI